MNEHSFIGSRQGILGMRTYAAVIRQWFSCYFPVYGELLNVQKYDAIVIGAGHNGLTNGAFLAKAGLNVLLLEKNDYIGGASASREIHKNWIYSNSSYVSSLLRPEVYRSMNLAKYGLQIVPYGGNATMSRDGDYIGSFVDPDVSRREMARLSPRDANAKVRFDRDIMRQSRFIRKFLLRMAPDPTSFKARDLKEMLYTGKALLNLGEEAIYDMMRLYTM